MTLAVDLGMTSDEFDEVVNELVMIKKRIFTRRVENDIPAFFTKHSLGSWCRRVSVYEAVDKHTSGRWAYIQVRRNSIRMPSVLDYIIAFEDPEDMTMFLMAYGSDT